MVEIESKPAPRLYVTAPLAAGAAIPLESGQAHYLRTVLRRSAGEPVLLFNGRDGEWLAELDALGKASGTAVVRQCRRPQVPEPDLWLLFAPVKGDRVDFVAEKATELGVLVLQPVLTRRSVVRRVNLDRLSARAAEAAEQCGRLTVPTVRPLMRLTDALDGWEAKRRLLVCAEAGEARPLTTVLGEERERGADRGPASSWAVLVGPEGGFAADELDWLIRPPFVTPVGLGPRLLRSETAALAALAIWQALFGDGGERPPVAVRDQI